MGSKSTQYHMKSSQHIQSEAPGKTSKKENALDIISKSILRVVGKKVKFNLNLYIMSTIKNNVKLIGNVGAAPVVTDLDNGKKVARFSLATNETFKNNKGEKQTETNWHNLVAWGKAAEIVEKYVDKGKEIAIDGKLVSRSYETKDKEKRYVTEIIVSEILLLGTPA